MTCREFVSFLDDFISGELPAPERAVFEAHLEGCSGCLRYMHGYLTAREAARGLLCEGEALPADVPEALVRAILMARSTRA